MHSFTIGGVPEYFNLPIKESIKNKTFEKSGISLHWKDIFEGTGAMAKMLSEGELDLAIILTEGITKSILEGNPSKIIHTYVKSPLNWGIHISAKSNFKEIEDLRNKTFGVSRFGSGSHLMALLLANNQDWSKNEINFKIVDHLEGARTAFKNQEIDAFLWEYLTTQPIVDLGEFKRIDIYPTPWSSFVIAARNEVIESHSSQLKKLIEIICRTCRTLKNSDDTPNKIESLYGLSANDSTEAFNSIEWSSTINLIQQDITKVIAAFDKANIQINQKDLNTVFHTL